MRQEAQSIYLRDGNEVYPPTPGQDRIIYGPNIVSEMRNGKYVSADGNTTRDMVIGLSPGWPDLLVGGIIDGRLDMNIVGIKM